jgi:signal transduction histidine kinase
VEPRRSLGRPILLGVVLISSIIALGAWVLVSIAAALGWSSAAFYTGSGVGMALLVLGSWGDRLSRELTVKAISLSQRQSNFIDSVTHELKSPLASLKLYLQTLPAGPSRPSNRPTSTASCCKTWSGSTRSSTTCSTPPRRCSVGRRRPRRPLLEPVLRACANAVRRYGVPELSVRLDCDAGLRRAAARPISRSCFAISSTMR